jgi:hypothetical protein
MHDPQESEEKKVTHRTLTIADLGWTEEQAAEIRAQLASFAEDWDDPAMDIYDNDQTLYSADC